MQRMGHLRHAVVTDIGRKRKNNEDNFGVFPGYGIFCVSDGMGGGDDGEVASEATVNAIRDFCAAYPPQEGGTYPIEGIVRHIRSSVNAASSWIYERAKEKKLKGCGATFVGICFDAANPGEAVALHAGDSRLYRIRGRSIQQITKDHSAAELIGAKNEKDINPMFRGMILRAVGIRPTVELERTPLSVKAGDRILICSDGLSRMVPDRKILSISRSNEDVFDAVNALIAAANAAGGIDNITAVLVEVGPLPDSEPTIPFPSEDDERSTEKVGGGDTADDSAQTCSTTGRTDSDSEGGKCTSTEETLPHVDAEQAGPAPSARARRRPWLGYVLSALTGVLIVISAIVIFKLFTHPDATPPVGGKDISGVPGTPSAQQTQDDDEPPVASEVQDQARLQGHEAEIKNLFLASCSNKIEAVEPIETRQKRLHAVLDEISVAVASNVVSETDAELLRASVRPRQKWIVGRIVNECSSGITIPLQEGDRWIATNASEIVTFTNGVPAKWIVSRDKYEDKELPRDFDGRKVVLKDGDFRLRPVLVKVSLEKRHYKQGISCWIGDKPIRDKKTVDGRPGEELVGHYRRNGYEDQPFRYKVTFDKVQCLPEPTTNWILRSVSIHVPDLPEGVTCWIGEQQITMPLTKRPGDCFDYVYRRKGYAPLTNVHDSAHAPYTVLLASRQELPKPLENAWKPLPVRVVAQANLPGDVRVLVDGKELTPGLLLMPGTYACRYERVDFRSQKKDFEVKVGEDARLPAPDLWHESDDVLKLSEIETAISNGNWIVTNELRSVKVEAKVNLERIAKLKEKIKIHERETAKKGTPKLPSIKKEDKDAARRRAEEEKKRELLAARRRAEEEKEFLAALDVLMKVCEPAAIKVISDKAKNIQILEKDNKDLFEWTAAYRKTKNLDEKTELTKKALEDVKKLAEELQEYWSMETEARADNLERKSVDDAKRTTAVDKANAFVKLYDVSNRSQMSVTLRAAADFLKSFQQAPFR